MKIPELSTAFCGCSLQTGTKIIAWIQIVLLVISGIFLVVFMAIGSDVIANMNEEKENGFFKSAVIGKDDEFWAEKRKQYGLPMTYPPLTQYQESTLGEDHLNNLNLKKSNEMEAFNSVLIGSGVVFVSIVVVILIIFLISTILLLLGAQKKRPGYLLFWLVLSVLCTIGSFFSMFQGAFLSDAVYFIIDLYFIWVVYSFYRQLEADSNKPSTQRAVGEI